MAVATQADGLKAQVRWDRYRKQYVWRLQDRHGQTLAAGEEFRLAPAFQNAHDSVYAVQMWTMFGRGQLGRNSDRLDFIFSPGNLKQ